MFLLNTRNTNASFAEISIAVIKLLIEANKTQSVRMHRRYFPGKIKKRDKNRYVCKKTKRIVTELN